MARYIGNGWWNDNGVVYHTPRYMATRGTSNTMQPAITNVSYHDGPVLQSPKIYLTLWGYKSSGDPQKVASLLRRFFADIGGSWLENIATQYYGQQGVHIANPVGQLGGVWEDNTNPLPSQPTDAQVAAEALNAVAKFGDDPNGTYVVATGHGHNTNGFGKSFCAYHGAAAQRGGSAIYYTNLPYQPDAGAACGAGVITAPPDESSADEGVTIVEGKMLMDSITDPGFSAWWDTFNGSEIGQLCVWRDIRNDPMAGGSSYTMQAEFSDASASCVHSFP